MHFRRVSAILVSSVCITSAASDPVADAVAALQAGNAGAAEQILQAELQKRPRDGDVLGVLGVVLDQEKKYAEADEIYRRALLVSHAPALLNNYGNHLISENKFTAAKGEFLQVLAADPTDVNARVQLARLSLQEKAAAQALNYLDRLPDDVLAEFDIAVLRMQAEYLAGHLERGDQLLGELESTKKDPQLGAALASAGQYSKAETFLSKALDRDPANFEILYDLGLAASHAGHQERARTALEAALRQQPENVDAIYDLAAVDLKLEQNTAALELLAKASKLAPQRQDILQLLARTSAESGYLSDAIEVWRKYLQVFPQDQTARRELAFDETAVGENAAEALRDLHTFVQRHPADALGHYELGTAEAASQPDAALKELSRALSLNSELPSAYMARGLLFYRQNRPENALADFEATARREPNNATVLERLGQTYLTLGDVNRALPVLRKAAGLAPSNSAILLQFGRALEKSGNTQEAASVFARCRELGPTKSQLPHAAGLIEFLSLTPEEQIARYRAGVEAAVRKDPENVEAEVRYLELLLDDRDYRGALAVTRKIIALKPTESLMEKAADPLIAGEQYASAAELLKGSSISSRALVIDRALVAYHLSDAKSGLQLVEQIPEQNRDGDFYLALGEMLNSDGRLDEARSAFDRAMQLKPTKPALYYDAIGLLFKDGDTERASKMLDRATAQFPEDFQLQALLMNVRAKR